MLGFASNKAWGGAISGLGERGRGVADDVVEIIHRNGSCGERALHGGGVMEFLLEEIKEVDIGKSLVWGDSVLSGTKPWGAFRLLCWSRCRRRRKGGGMLQDLGATAVGEGAEADVGNLFVGRGQ